MTGFEHPTSSTSRPTSQGQRTWRWLGAATALLAAVVFGVVLAGGLDLGPSVFGSTPTPQTLGDGTTSPRFSDVVAADADRQIASFADLAEAVLPAVVTVRSTTVEEAPGGQDVFRFFQRRNDDEEPREFRRQGTGSGFFISPDGWLVTNFHVVDGATEVEVRYGEETLEAEVRGADPSTDLAVLKVDETDGGFPHLAVGDSDGLRVGDWVMAVGSPLGMTSSVTVGVVSGKGRVLGITGDTAFDDFIQTDAAINRGNSGGPLVNTRGEVIGVSTAMNYGAENIGFAVSSKVLTSVLPDLRGEGRVSRGYLGVGIRDLEEGEARAFRLGAARGVLVRTVEAKPARDAGLRAGDVIVRVDGRPVADTSELIQNISSRKPGDKVRLGIIRRGDAMDKTVTLGDRGEELGATTTIEQEPSEPESTNLEWLDVEIEPLTSALRQTLRLEEDIEGVVLRRIGNDSPLTDKGVVEFDIVREVNGEGVSSPRAFLAEVAKVESGDPLLLFVYSPRRGGFQDFVVVERP